jgi:DNA-directed RNA polymerase subunit RPC12/RpoP
MSKLVAHDGRIAVQFQCGDCAHTYVTDFTDLGTSYRCDACGGRANTLPVLCLRAGCWGRYGRCGGPIERLSDAERAAFRGPAAEAPARPMAYGASDDAREDLAEARAELAEARAAEIAYRCGRCGALSDEAFAAEHDACERLVCDSCASAPKLEGLPPPEPLPYALVTPAQVWRD